MLCHKNLYLGTHFSIYLNYELGSDVERAVNVPVLLQLPHLFRAKQRRSGSSNAWLRYFQLQCAPTCLVRKGLTPGAAASVLASWLLYVLPRSKGSCFNSPSATYEHPQSQGLQINENPLLFLSWNIHNSKIQRHHGFHYNLTSVLIKDFCNDLGMSCN